MAAHQADRLPHHRRAVAGVPELHRGPQHGRHGVEHHEARQRVLRHRVDTVRAARGGRLGEFGEIRQGVFLGGLEGPPLGPARRHALSGEVLVFRPLERIEFVEHPCRREPERRRRLARRPDIHQPVQRVFFLLQPELEAPRPRLCGAAAAEPAPVVADDRLDGRQHLRRRHQPHGDPRPAEDRVE